MPDNLTSDADALRALARVLDVPVASDGTGHLPTLERRACFLRGWLTSRADHPSGSLAGDIMSAALDTLGRHPVDYEAYGEAYGEPCCGAERPDGWTCTLPAGHDGQHEAHGALAYPYATWARS